MVGGHFSPRLAMEIFFPTLSFPPFNRATLFNRITRKRARKVWWKGELRADWCNKIVVIIEEEREREDGRCKIDDGEIRQVDREDPESGEIVTADRWRW